MGLPLERVGLGRQGCSPLTLQSALSQGVQPQGYHTPEQRIWGAGLVWWTSVVSESGSSWSVDMVAVLLRPPPSQGEGSQQLCGRRHQ